MPIHKLVLGKADQRISTDWSDFMDEQPAGETLDTVVSTIEDDDSTLVVDDVSPSGNISSIDCDTTACLKRRLYRVHMKATTTPGSHSDSRTTYINVVKHIPADGP